MTPPIGLEIPPRHSTRPRGLSPRTVGRGAFAGRGWRRAITTAFLAFFACVASSCGRREGIAAPTGPVAPQRVVPASVTGSRWIVEQIDGVPVLASTEITLVISRNGIAGFDRCNQFGGSFVEPGQFRIADITSTAVGCPEPVLAQSRRLDDALRQLGAGRRRRHEFELQDASGRPRLLLTPEPDFGPQAAKVANTQWRLKQSDRQRFTGAPVTLGFGRSTFLIGVGCGQQTGAYMIQHDRIGFPRREMDIRHCPGGLRGRGPDPAALKPLEVMESARRVRVDRDTLAVIGTNHRSVVFERCDACVPRRTSLKVARWTPQGLPGTEALAGRLAVRDQCLGIVAGGRWSPIALHDPGMYWDDDSHRLMAAGRAFALEHPIRLTGSRRATDGTADPDIGLYPEDCSDGSIFLVGAVQ